MNDDQILLASAYLDGDVDAAARALAEADPEVLTEVTRLRALRAALRDVGEPDVGRRERAIDAALAAFVDEPATAVARPTEVVPLAHRPRRAWWGAVAAAAAVLVVVVAGAISIGGGGGRDQDDSAASATTSLARASQEATLAAPDDSSSLDAAAPAPAPPAGESESDTGDAPAATSRAAEGTADVGSDVQLSASLPNLTTRDELAAFAAAAAAGGAADAPRAPSEAAACTHAGTFVGPARYDRVVVEVFVDGDVVSALDASTCALVAEVER